MIHIKLSKEREMEVMATFCTFCPVEKQVGFSLRSMSNQEKKLSLRDHSSIMSAKSWEGGVRKWYFFLIYSTIYADVGRWVGLKNQKTYCRNT